MVGVAGDGKCGLWLIESDSGLVDGWRDMYALIYSSGKLNSGRAST
jgi:hypothetical protein